MRKAVVISVLAAALVAAASARADGDPASDWLITREVFIPPDLGVPQAYANQLGAVLQDARTRGYTIRVALIGSRYDLGSIPIMFHRPKEYAPFLSQELRFAYRGRVLTVMSNGYGYARNGNRDPAAQAILNRLPAPGTGGARIAAAATRAVVSLAAAAGVRVAVPPLHGSTSTASTSQDRLTIALAAAGAVLLLGFVWLFRRVRASRAG
jgi:hypothetical protein